MAGLHFDITGDNSNFLRKLEESRNGVRATTKQIEQSGMSIEQMFGRMTSAAAAFGVSLGAKQLVSDIIRVRGEFQQLEVAFKTMLGSKEQSDTLMSQLVKTAAITPYDLQGVANGAKQLLAYGTSAKNVNETLVRLGDIAAGLSIPLNDIVYLYGTTMTQGRLFTQDLRQFMGRGIPLADELAKLFGVTKDKVGELVTAGKVGFPEVQKAIEAMTNEGGKFGGLMEAQSKTITGQISNIEDSFSTMFNNIGKNSEGIINGTLGAVSMLVENYEEVGNTLIELVGVYGTYRVALMTTTALQFLQAGGIGALTVKEAVHYGWLVMQKKAQDALNRSILTNPYVMAAAAVAALSYGVYKLATYTTDAEKAQSKLNDSAKEMEKASLSEHRELARLKGELSTLTKGTDEYNTVKDKIVKGYGKYYDGLDTEIEKVGLTETAYNKLTEAINQSFAARQYEKFSKEQSDELENVMSENLAKIQDRLYGELGDEAGAKAYAQIRNGILQGTFGLGDRMYEITGLSEELQQSLNKVAGKDGGVFDVTNRSVESYISNILKAKEVTDDIDKKARERFGIETDYSPTKKTATETSTTQEEAKNKKYWEDKKKEAEAARDALDVSERNSKKWNEYTKQIQEAQVQIDKYSSPSKQQKESDKQLKQQEQLSEQLLSLRRKNQQDEINLMADGTEKKLKQIDLDYQKELDAIRKQKAEWEKAQGGKLTDEQTSLLGERSSNNAKGREKAISDVRKQELEANKRAWQEYFIEYGNYQEKRKNLIQKYDDEIAKLQAGSPEYATKTAEKNQALAQLDEQYGKSTKAMADLFEDASDKSVNTIQAVIDKYELLVSYLSGGNGATVGDLKAVGFTDKDLKSIENGTINIKDVTDAIKNLKGTLAGKSPFKKFAEDIKEGVGDIKNAKGDTDAIGTGISKIGNAVVAFSGPLKEFSSNIGNIFGFDDSKIQGAIDAVSGLGQTAAGVGQIMSGDIVGGAMSAVSGISQVVSALDGMFGADYSHYNEMVEQYGVLNDIWDELIDKKLEYINTSYGAEANKVGEEALELAKKSIESYRILGRERLNAGASVGSHSIGVRIRKGMSQQGWDELRKASQEIGFNYNAVADGRMTGLFDLTAEQLEKLKAEAPTFWAKLDGDVREYLDNIIEGEERIEDIQNKISEQLTQITFDSVYDNFVDTLMDMKASSKDAAEDVSEYFMRAMLSQQIGSLYQDKLKEWYKKFSEGMKDGSLSDKERNALNSEYIQYVEEAMKLRDELAAATGYDKIANESTSQSSTSRGLGTEMTHEDVGELSGRFTALQITGEETKNAMLSMLAIANVLSVSVNSNGTILLEIKNLMASSNGYLEDISIYTKKMLDGFSAKLDSINKNIEKAL